MCHPARIAGLLALCSLAGCAVGPPPPTPGTAVPIRITLVEVVASETFPLELAVHVQGEPPGEGCWTYPSAPTPEIAAGAVTVTITSSVQSGACSGTPWRYDAVIPLGSDFATGEYTLWVNTVEQNFDFESGFGP